MQPTNGTTFSFSSSALVLKNFKFIVYKFIFKSKKHEKKKKNASVIVRLHTFNPKGKTKC